MKPNTSRHEEIIVSEEPIFEAPFDGDVYIINGGKSRYLFTIERGMWRISSSIDAQRDDNQ